LLEENNHIDKLFSDYLGDFEEKAPTYVWQNIQADLHNQKRLKRNYRLQAIAASIALLLTFGLGYISSDIAQKNRAEARYLDLNSLNRNDNIGFINSSDSSPLLDKNSIRVQNLNIAKNDVSNTNIKIATRQFENKSFIYRIFDLSKEQFLLDSDKKANNNFLASNKEKANKSNSNQLLIDTLLLEEGSLYEGGFLLSQKSEKYSRWSFGTKFSPVYSVAESADQLEQTNNPLLKSAMPDENSQTAEKSLLAFSGGLNVNYRFTQRWSVESGIFYSQRRQMADNLVGSAMKGLDNEMLVYTPDGIKQLESQINSQSLNNPQLAGKASNQTMNTSDMNYISNFDYLELPIIVRYRIIDRKIGFDVLSGISTNFLIGNHSSIVQDDVSLWTGQNQEISPLLYNATIGLGLNYNFYQNFSFNLEPTFKYSLINSENTTMTQYPYSFAVFAGFSYRFK